MKISISICPTDLEAGSEGDRYDEAALLEAIREFIEARLGTVAEIVCLQVGHRQGDKWARIDGDEESGAALLADFFEDHGIDEDLFLTPPEPVMVEVATSCETIRECVGLEDHDEACAAYRRAAIDSIEDSGLRWCNARGQRVLLSQWMGAKFAFRRGAIGTFATLTDSQRAAIDAADEAGRAAAQKVIENAV
jgi:hypothetical protein